MKKLNFNFLHHAINIKIKNSQSLINIKNKKFN